VTFSVYQYVRFAAALLTTGGGTLYTVPASTQAIVKDIDISNPTATAAVLTLQITGGVPILQNISIPGGATVHWTGLIVLNAGEIISGQASVASTLYATISGQTGV
jgi:hypothetical protein